MEKNRKKSAIILIIVSIFVWIIIYFFIWFLENKKEPSVIWDLYDWRLQWLD